ncbi:unnamed protein product [Meloidogyne enterolobii]|uniref:Uncharacterized protein n=1 Tax=Meloidogyne enterolobii TaxID=390850 RepID=A0ACB0ZIN3_MELEN
MPNASNKFSIKTSTKNTPKTPKRCSIPFNQNLIYFSGIIFVLIFFVCQCSAQPVLLANNDDIALFKLKREQLEHQMKKRFYAWDEMSAKRSLIPSARALSHMGLTAGDASAEELIGHLLAEQQQHNQQQLTPNNMLKRGMQNMPSERSSLAAAALAANLLHFQRPYSINRMILDEQYS